MGGVTPLPRPGNLASERQSCFIGVKSPAALAFRGQPLKGGDRVLELPQSQGLPLSQAVLSERSAQRRKLLARGAGTPPAFLASGWTQVDTLPFVSLGVLLVVVGFVFWEVFSFLFFWVFFLHLAHAGRWDPPGQFHFQAPMH